MKKWSEPEIVDLSLKETRGGPHYTEKADGSAVYDKGTDSWWTPSGDHNKPHS